MNERRTSGPAPEPAPRGARAHPSRREALARAGALLLAGGLPAGPLIGGAVAQPVPDANAAFEEARRLARDLAARPYAPPDESLPAALAALSYDDYRATTFVPERSPMASGSRFTIEMFGRGFLHKERVGLSLIGAGRAGEPLAYDPAMFAGRTPGAEAALRSLDPAVARDLDFAGFRLHHREALEGRAAEFLVFLGASYFRLIGRGQQYGLSGRALSVGTGLPGAEEFPGFRRHWIEVPAPGSDEVRVVSLVDSPSLSGAYRFTARYGATSRLGVEAQLHPRGPVRGLGLAPLTSMFFFGPAGPRFDDFRPAVHDSDGLFVDSAEGGPLWRPLTNPRAARTTTLPVERLRAFGLLQRRRLFRDYLDVEARHEDRPGLVVTPRGDWEPGEVKLFEFPTVEEYHDNVVAWWAPRREARAGQLIDLAYDVATVGGEAVPASLARAVTVRVGSAERLRPQGPLAPGRRLYFADFEGETLPADGAAPLRAEVRALGGAVVEPVVTRVPQTGGWRLYVEHREDPARPGGLTARLTLNDVPLTETLRLDP